jgi:probable F420-dependent oxidoreductase
VDLSGVGVWSSQLRYGNPDEAAEAAAELDDLGFTALWIPDAGGPVLDSVDHLLASTKQVVIATGILNLWMHKPSDVAARYASLTKTYGDRFLLGIGCSNAALIDSVEPGRYRKPLAATRSFLDTLDAAEQPVPVENRVLAALGPKMLELSATRARGAHPYLGTPDHTRQAREVLGDGPLLLPELTVVLTENRAEARAIGTDWLRAYIGLPNYANRCCAPASRPTTCRRSATGCSTRSSRGATRRPSSAGSTSIARPERTTYAFKSSPPTQGNSRVSSGAA